MVEGHAPAPVEAHGQAHAVEAGHGHEATHASNTWLDKSRAKLSRWFGHGLRFSGSEFSIAVGSLLLTGGTISSIIAPNPLSIGVAAIGGALAGGGTAIEWDAMKNAGSKFERRLFGLSKAAQIIGAPIAAAVAAPVYAPVATGMYLAGVGMGARSMAHRK